MLYFLAIETTSRRLAATSSFLAWSLIFLPVVIERIVLRRFGSVEADVLLQGPELAGEVPDAWTWSSSASFFLRFLAALISRSSFRSSRSLMTRSLSRSVSMIFSRWAGAEVEVPDQAAHLDDDPAPGQGEFPGVRDLVQPAAEVPDLLDLGQDLLLLLLELALGDVVLADVEHLLDDQRLDLDLLLEAQDLVQDEPGLGQGLDDRLLAALDLPGDGDLALAGQEGDVAHLPQVELDRIGRPLQALEGHELALAPLGNDLLLLRVEDLDPVIVDGAQEIVEALLGLQLVLEGLVDLLEEQVALLPALGDELGNVALGEFIFSRHAGLLRIRRCRYP